MWKLRSGVTRLPGVIKSLERGELFRRFDLQNPPKRWWNWQRWRNLSVESDSQANQRNQTKVLPATTTLKWKAASSEQTIVLCLCACLATKWLHFGPHPASPGLHVNTSISLPRVGEVPHLSGVMWTGPNSFHCQRCDKLKNTDFHNIICETLLFNLWNATNNRLRPFVFQVFPNSHPILSV